MMGEMQAKQEVRKQIPFGLDRLAVLPRFKNGEPSGGVAAAFFRDKPPSDYVYTKRDGLV
jgi:hypothetical protein